MKDAMSVNEAVEVANDLLKPIIRYFNTIGFFYMYTYEDSYDKKFRNIFIWSDQKPKKLKRVKLKNIEEDDHCEDMLFLLEYKGFRYIVQFYDDLDDIGYNTVYYHYNKETYVACIIEKYDKFDDQLGKMVFGFDVEKMTLVEIFDIEKTVKEPVLREFGVEFGKKKFYNLYDVEEAEDILCGTKLNGVLYYV